MSCAGTARHRRTQVPRTAGRTCAPRAYGNPEACGLRSPGSRSQARYSDRPAQTNLQTPPQLAPANRSARLSSVSHVEPHREHAQAGRAQIGAQGRRPHLRRQGGRLRRCVVARLAHPAPTAWLMRAACAGNAVERAAGALGPAHQQRVRAAMVRSPSARRGHLLWWPLRPGRSFDWAIHARRPRPAASTRQPARMRPGSGSWRLITPLTRLAHRRRRPRPASAVGS